MYHLVAELQATALAFCINAAVQTDLCSETPMDKSNYLCASMGGVI